MDPAESAPRANRPLAGGAGLQMQRWLELLGLGETDAQRLRRMAPSDEQHAVEFVDAFFRRLRRFEDTARILTDETLAERLKELQMAHFRSLLQARWDDDFLFHRNRVGEAHAERGIAPEFLLGSYSHYVGHCLRRLETEAGVDVEQMAANSLSLFKAILLDIGLTLQAYFAQSTDDLRQALDMYWRANNELRNFAQLASHDLKTPLATVANLCEEVLDEFGDEMPAEACELIERAKMRSYRMSGMIDELLAASLSSRIETVPVSAPLGEVLAEAVELVRPMLQAKKISLRAPESLPTVRGDRTRLREAFFNLLSNAAKFIDRPNGRIEIASETVDCEAVISIRDNGPGIPPDELDRVFVPFRRLPQHRDLPGSGLGLYFTKNLIEQEGGRVWAAPAPGRGACFLVALKLGGEEA